MEERRSEIVTVAFGEAVAGEGSSVGGVGEYIAVFVAGGRVEEIADERTGEIPASELEAEEGGSGMAVVFVGSGLDVSFDEADIDRFEVVEGTVVVLSDDLGVSTVK